MNLEGKAIWTEMGTLSTLVADTYAVAAKNAIDNPSILKQYGYKEDGTLDPLTVLRLNEVKGSNGTTFVIYSEFNNYGSARVGNFINPASIPLPNSSPSASYAARFFIGGPPGVGEELSAVAGLDLEVGWFWNPAVGVLIFDKSIAPPSLDIPSKEIYFAGFQYVGKTAQDSGGTTGDHILLTSNDGQQWRIKSDGALLRMQRYDKIGTGGKWTTYGSMGNTLGAEGLTLTPPYNINYDLGNSLDQTAESNLISAVKMSGVNETLVYGNPVTRTVLLSKRWSNIQRDITFKSPTEIESRPLRDKFITLDDTNPTIEWITQFQDIGTGARFMRLRELAFDVEEISDEINGVKCRIAVYDEFGNMLQENISAETLNAGGRNNFTLKKGLHWYKLNPTYGDLVTSRRIVKITVRKGYQVKLYAGTYDQIDPRDLLLKQFDVPYQKSIVEPFDQFDLLDQYNIRKSLPLATRVILDTGVELDFVDKKGARTLYGEQYNLVGASQHGDVRNATLGNYWEKTYINSGAGGIWNITETSKTNVNFWSSADRTRIFKNIQPDAFILTDTLEIPFMGLFTKELEDAKADLVNIYSFEAKIEYPEADLAIPQQQYQQKITLLPQNYDLFRNQDDFEFLDDLPLPAKYTINANEPADYKTLYIPTQYFTCARDTNKSLKLKFKKPIRVYGYYEDPVDPANPLPSEFRPQIRASVRIVAEDEILTGSEIEDKIDAVIGEKEWKEASELGLASLHVVPSLLALADRKGEWLLFDAGRIYYDTDIHQWLFSTGRAAVYRPMMATGGTFVNNIFEPPPLVVHLPRPEDVNQFDVILLTQTSPTTATTVNFTFYINTYKNANSSKITLSVPRDKSVVYTFVKGRDGLYLHRAAPYNNDLAGTRNPEMSHIDIPVDPKPPVKVPVN